MRWKWANNEHEWDVWGEVPERDWVNRVIRYSGWISVVFAIWKNQTLMYVNNMSCLGQTKVREYVLWTTADNSIHAALSLGITALLLTLSLTHTNATLSYMTSMASCPIKVASVSALTVAVPVPTKLSRQ